MKYKKRIPIIVGVDSTNSFQGQEATMRINKVALFCFAIAGLQSCSSNGTNPSPSLPEFERTSALRPAELAIDNSEYMDAELAASKASR